MLKASIAPHLREYHHSFYQSGGVLLCLIPLVGFSCVYYGVRPLLLVLSGMIAAVFSEVLCCAVAGRRPTLSDGTAAVSGALIGAMMSPITPLWVPAIGAAFAIGVAKMPFGGVGHTIFNPAAAGMAFCAICFATRLFQYPDPMQLESLPIMDTTQVITAMSPTQQLAAGGNPNINIIKLFSGDFPGPIGSAGVLILVASAVFLFARRTSSPYVFVPYIATCALFAIVFPRADFGVGMSIQLELCTGLLLFCGVFLLGDSATAPRFWLARIVYGVLAGLLVMILRHYGRFECCEFFAVLLVNSFSALLDRTCWSLIQRGRRWKEARS